jgi:hypothetical protein
MRGCSNACASRHTMAIGRDATAAPCRVRQSRPAAAVQCVPRGAGRQEIGPVRPGLWTSVPIRWCRASGAFCYPGSSSNHSLPAARRQPIAFAGCLTDFAMSWTRRVSLVSKSSCLVRTRLSHRWKLNQSRPAEAITRYAGATYIQTRMPAPSRQPPVTKKAPRPTPSRPPKNPCSGRPYGKRRRPQSAGSPRSRNLRRGRSP